MPPVVGSGAAVTALALAPGGDRIALGRADGTLDLRPEEIERW